MNQHSPSTLSMFSVNRALEVEPCSSTDFLSQCGFFFFKSEISESKATLCTGLVFLPSPKAHNAFIYDSYDNNGFRENFNHI